MRHMEVGGVTVSALDAVPCGAWHIENVAFRVVTATIVHAMPVYSAL